MNEGEGEIQLSRLVRDVLLYADLGLLCHLGHAEAADIPHLADSDGDLLELGLVVCPVADRGDDRIHSVGSLVCHNIVLLKGIITNKKNTCLKHFETGA